MTYQVCDLGHLPELAEVRTYFGLTLDGDWLNAVQIVISPDNAVVVLVHGEKMSIFMSNNSSNLQPETRTYLLQWLGTLANPNEIITSVVCLPCHIIVIGLDTGAVQFYDENGNKLYSQRFAAEPLINVKCHFSATGNVNDNFLLYIFYVNSIVMLKSIDFLDKILDIKKPGANQYLQHNQLEYYSHYTFPTANREIEDKCGNKSFYNEVNDVIVIPHQVTTACDLIIETSPSQNIGDLQASSYQQYNLVISVGSKYFLAFHKATETKRKILQSEKDSRIRLQMDTLCQFHDHRREGRRVYVSPNGVWAAIVDNLERVLLVDIVKRIVVRVWKGYPEAQCGFLYVPEHSTIHAIPTHSYTPKTTSTRKRGAMFLEIYVPSSGCLEVWSLLYGSKVARFNLCKSGQFVYKTPKPIGMDTNKQTLAERSSGYFIDPNDGSIKVIDIPFHYALDTVNGEISADMQNLRNLKRQLEKYSRNQDDVELSSIESLSRNFQTMVGREQCLILLLNEERLQHSIYTRILNALYQKVRLELNELLENPELDYALLKKRENLQLEITIYDKYKELDQFIKCLLQQILADERRKSLPKLQLANSDHNILNQWIKDVNLIKQLQLRESPPPRECQDNSNVHIDYEDSSEDNSGKIHEDFLGLVLKFSMKFHFATLQSQCSQAYRDFFQLLFERHCQTESGLTILRNALKTIKELNSINLITFLFNFWLDENSFYQDILRYVVTLHLDRDEAIADMTLLSAQLRLIYEVMEADKNNYDNYNDIITFWQEIREMLLDYTEPIALPMVITCKTLALQLIHNQMEKKDVLCPEETEKATNSNNEDDKDEEDVSSLDENWESISQEETQWSLLISKLEPTLILSAVLRDTSSNDGCSSAQMPSIPSAHELENCSLKTVLTGGKGIVTDLTAQWIIAKRLHPVELVKLSSGHEANLIEAIIEPKNTLLHLIAVLKRYFPYSLEPCLLLCLMAWHYTIYWSKHLEQLECFEAAMTCLKQLKPEHAVLKQQLGCLLWRAAIKIPFHLVGKLIHKIGHLPTEKLCQQELGMSAVAITRFLELSLEFLLELNRTVIQCHESTQREYNVRYEDILIEGPEAIQSLIVRQQPVIQTLLELQTELCYVLHFITFFQLKYAKLLTKLFDNARYAAFFVDINSEKANNNQSTVRSSPRLGQAHADLQTTRSNFLRRTITAAIDLLRMNVDGTVFAKEYLKYTRRVLSLTNLWVLDQQTILRQQVLDLYAHDYDSIAESILGKCEGDPNISAKLLEIAGLRLNVYVTASSYRFRLMAKGPKLLQHQDYLTNRPENDENMQITCNEAQDIDIERLKDLTMNAMKFMEFTDPKDKHLVGVANEMYHVCLEFIQLDKLKTAPPPMNNTTKRT